MIDETMIGSRVHRPAVAGRHKGWIHPGRERVDGIIERFEKGDPFAGLPPPPGTLIVRHLDRKGQPTNRHEVVIAGRLPPDWISTDAAVMQES